MTPLLFTVCLVEVSQSHFGASGPAGLRRQGSRWRAESSSTISCFSNLAMGTWEGKHWVKWPPPLSQVTLLSEVGQVQRPQTFPMSRALWGFEALVLPCEERGSEGSSVGRTRGTAVRAALGDRRWGSLCEWLDISCEDGCMYWRRPRLVAHEEWDCIADQALSMGQGLDQRFGSLTRPLTLSCTFENSLKAGIGNN
jgi:hypothetical protein